MKLDRCPVVVQNPLADGKPQPASLPRRLAGDEGLEQPLPHGLRDAGTGVGHIQDRRGSLLEGADGNLPGAFGGMSALNLKIIRSILYSWVITIPFTALLSMGCFKLLAMVLLP